MSELNIGTVNIMMGDTCNFNCRYCLQKENVCTQERKTIDDSVIDYINHLVNIRPKTANKLMIYFWGGEPLLYPDIIKYVVDKLKDSVYYTIITNGSQLNQEWVEFLNKHRIPLILSHDGPETLKTRGINILEDPNFIQLFNQIIDRGVDVCVSAYNQDYYSAWNYLEEKLGSNITIFHDPLVVTWNMPEDLYAFDFDAYRKTMQIIIEKAYESVLNQTLSREYFLLEKPLNKILKILNSKKNKNHLYCPTMRSAISIDLDGNVNFCHNKTKKLGSVTDSFDILLDNFDKAYKQQKEKMSSCEQCEYASLCGYGCLNSSDSLKGREACCTMNKILIDACLQFIKKFELSLESVDLSDDYVCN